MKLYLALLSACASVALAAEVGSSVNYGGVHLNQIGDANCQFTDGEAYKFPYAYGKYEVSWSDVEWKREDGLTHNICRLCFIYTVNRPRPIKLNGELCSVRYTT